MKSLIWVPWAVLFVGAAGRIIVGAAGRIIPAFPASRGARVPRLVAPPYLEASDAVSLAHPPPILTGAGTGSLMKGSCDVARSAWGLRGHLPQLQAISGVFLPWPDPPLPCKVLLMGLSGWGVFWGPFCWHSEI